METQVILVDKTDHEIGCAEKQLAHVQGLLHRAFSLFVFNSRGELLIQQRNRHKYHTPGLWSNTCCSHPRPGEYLEAAVHRRLQEEMGFDCELKELFSCSYRLELDNGLIEHENNHVCIGFFDGEPWPDPAEVDDWRWQSLEHLATENDRSSPLFTPWFCLIIHNYKARLHDAINTFGTGETLWQRKHQNKEWWVSG